MSNKIRAGLVAMAAAHVDPLDSTIAGTAKAPKAKRMEPSLPAKPERVPRVKDWSLKRSGAHMTLTGMYEGKPLTIAGIERVWLRDDGQIIATHKDGREHALATR